MKTVMNWHDERGAEIVEEGPRRGAEQTFSRWTLSPSHAVKQRAELEADDPTIKPHLDAAAAMGQR